MARKSYPPKQLLNDHCSNCKSCQGNSCCHCNFFLCEFDTKIQRGHHEQDLQTQSGLGSILKTTADVCERMCVWQNRAVLKLIKPALLKIAGKWILHSHKLTFQNQTCSNEIRSMSESSQLYQLKVFQRTLLFQTLPC